MLLWSRVRKPLGHGPAAFSGRCRQILTMLHTGSHMPVLPRSRVQHSQKLHVKATETHQYAEPRTINPAFQSSLLVLAQQQANCSGSAARAEPVHLQPAQREGRVCSCLLAKSHPDICLDIMSAGTGQTLTEGLGIMHSPIHGQGSSHG